MIEKTQHVMGEVKNILITIMLGVSILAFRKVVPVIVRNFFLDSFPAQLNLDFDEAADKIEVDKVNHMFLRVITTAKNMRSVNRKSVKVRCVTDITSKPQNVALCTNAL